MYNKKIYVQKYSNMGCPLVYPTKKMMSKIFLIRDESKIKVLSRNCPSPVRSCPEMIPLQLKRKNGHREVPRSDIDL